MTTEKIDWKRRALAAEKTADVLKTKVRELYNGGAQTAIHRQLDALRKRAEESIRKRAVMEAKTDALRAHSERLEAEVAERTQALKTIFDHVTFGFVVIDAELRIAEGFTKSCEALFGRTVQAGDDIRDFLNLATDGRRADYALALEQVFDDWMPEELTVHQVRQRFELADGRVLRVEPRIVRDAAGEVACVLLTISDTTALEEAQRESQKNRVLIGILQQREAFRSFVEDTRGLLSTAEKAAQSGDTTLLRRAVHTVKGNAASYGLAGIAAQIHSIEEQDAIAAGDIDTIRGAFQTFLEDNAEVLSVQWDVGAAPDLVLAPIHVEDLHTLLGRVQADAARAVRGWLASVLLRPAGSMLGPLDEFVERLAVRLDKDVRLELVGMDTLVDTQMLRPVFQNLAHLIRNALDHGIESPDARGDKPPTATLRVEVADDGADYVVHVEDDGRGIDTQRLVDRAIAKGFLDADTACGLDEQQRVSLIFRDSLSSAEQATDVSGRGVGMSAVRAAVAEAGGQITVDSTKGQGTRMTMRIPHAEVRAPDLPLAADVQRAVG